MTMYARPYVTMYAKPYVATPVFVLASVVAWTAAFVAPLHGQSRGFWRDPAGEISVHANAVVPVGEFGDQVDLGAGLGVAGLLFLSEDRRLALRIEGGVAVYGVDSYRESRDVGLVPYDYRVWVANSIVSGGAGPQIFFASEGLRPYVFGTVGVSHFLTEIRTDESDDRYHDRDDDWDWFDDDAIRFRHNNVAVVGGAGIAVEVRGGSNPIALDLSASYQHNGLTEYFPHGAIGPGSVDFSDPYGGRYRRDRHDRHGRDRDDYHDHDRRGVLLTDPIVGNANLLTVRLGVSIGLY